MRTPFRENGKITVGTSSPLNAGACALLFMAKETAEAKGVKAMAKVRSIGFAGVEPNLMGKGPVPATRKALKDTYAQSRAYGHDNIHVEGILARKLERRPPQKQLKSRPYRMRA